VAQKKSYKNRFFVIPSVLPDTFQHAYNPITNDDLTGIAASIARRFTLRQWAMARDRNQPADRQRATSHTVDQMHDEVIQHYEIPTQFLRCSPTVPTPLECIEQGAPCGFAFSNPSAVPKPRTTVFVLILANLGASQQDCGPCR